MSATAGCQLRRRCLLSLDEYLRLLDWCGREVREDKRGTIPADLPPILERLGVDEDELIETVR